MSVSLAGQALFVSSLLSREIGHLLHHWHFVAMNL